MPVNKQHNVEKFLCHTASDVKFRRFLIFCMCLRRNLNLSTHQIVYMARKFRRKCYYNRQERRNFPTKDYQQKIFSTFLCQAAIKTSKSRNMKRVLTEYKPLRLFFYSSTKIAKIGIVTSENTVESSTLFVANAACPLY